jgi:RNA polymerase sigma-70 factor (ECF subfamily)
MKLTLIPHRKKARKDASWFTLFTEGHRPAFSHYFESLYPGLFIYARKMLSDQAAARKVVLFAFVSAWRQRQDFTSPERLKQFILDSVREGCTTYRLALVRDHKHAHAGATDKFSVFSGLEGTGPQLEWLHKEILAEMAQRPDCLNN